MAIARACFTRFVDDRAELKVRANGMKSTEGTKTFAVPSVDFVLLARILITGGIESQRGVLALGLFISLPNTKPKSDRGNNSAIALRFVL